ncbi:MULTISPECIES: patatin family protein [Gammaproteobacteria]|uniref:patatin-like phospholipase family protein n=1 Tax=Gammaproteobacteria TaxID=1236 RepID=UPI000DD0E872|nr:MULTISPECIES: patatin family protein [Gammaproteobacteria]RTE86693.1 patatin family protein [Aliidiomarina sp. B3213]TCZ90753.1 patatin family protein [Lysobacter sp. N42]
MAEPLIETTDEPVDSDRKHTLVVEGGAMRGIFAAGVLDAFIEQDFYPFDAVVGVSAGSTNSIGYLAGNYQRSYKIITEYARRDEFMNIRRYLRGGHFCDVSWLWHSSLDELPLDIDAFMKRKIPLTVVTTSVKTGEACYFTANKDNLVDLFPASCAMPVVFREFPPIEEEPMTDGGLADSIPVVHAYEQGAKQITVILSQPLGFKKNSDRFPGLLKPLFKDHPALFEAVVRRGTQYNEALEFIANPPKDCDINIIAPPSNFPVSRFTMELSALDMGYRQGENAGNRFIAESLIRSDATHA